MHTKNIIKAGQPLTSQSKVLILLHGRGATAEDILSLSHYLNVKDFALLAPQATNNSWYPQSFLSPTAQNEPWLSSALSIINKVVEDVLSNGVIEQHIYFAGFSQGACLTLEYITRNARKYGGAVAFTGGLIGDKLYTDNYAGDFQQTPVFIGTSDPDPHVPVQRVLATEAQLKKMNANVQVKVYPNMGHTINDDEIKWANELVFI